MSVIQPPINVTGLTTAKLDLSFSDCGDVRLQRIGAPVANQDVATKLYVDNSNPIVSDTKDITFTTDFTGASATVSVTGYRIGNLIAFKLNANLVIASVNGSDSAINANFSSFNSNLLPSGTRVSIIQSSFGRRFPLIFRITSAGVVTISTDNLAADSSTATADETLPGSFRIDAGTTVSVLL